MKIFIHEIRQLHIEAFLKKQNIDLDTNTHVVIDYTPYSIQKVGENYNLEPCNKRILLPTSVKIA